jgi:hypothetical protein
MPSIDFNMQKQEHTDWCWSAVATSVDHYFDAHSAWCQCRLASKMAKIEKLKVTTCGSCQTRKPIHEACNRPWYLEKALKIVHRLKGKPKPGFLSFSQILKKIKAGRPVCVMVLWGKGPAAHFVVISGCTRGRRGERWVDIEDPDVGSSTWLYEEFRSNYQYYKGSWHYTFLVQDGRTSHATKGAAAFPRDKKSISGRPR